MLNVSPTIAKFIAAALAIAAVVIAYVLVPTGPGHEMLLAIAGGIIGKEFALPTGAARVDGVHPDDLRG